MTSENATTFLGFTKPEPPTGFKRIFYLFLLRFPIFYRAFFFLWWRYSQYLPDKIYYFFHENIYYHILMYYGDQSVKAW